MAKSPYCTTNGEAIRLKGPQRPKSNGPAPKNKGMFK